MTPSPRLRRLLLLAACCATLLPAAAQNQPADWPNLARFRADNAALGAPAAGQARVVFMGDSITEGWSRFGPEMYSDAARINRGIGGQTTSQMLLRFRADVIALRPRAVVILAGTNDIAGNTGPVDNTTIAGHVASMVELAQAHGIRVLLVSVLPADRYWWAPAVKPALRIVELNRLLQAEAARLGVAWLDLHTPMADAGGGLKPEYGEDGVHPNATGYRAMRAAVEPALAALLQRP